MKYLHECILNNIRSTVYIFIHKYIIKNISIFKKGIGIESEKYSNKLEIKNYGKVKDGAQ